MRYVKHAIFIGMIELFFTSHLVYALPFSIIPNGSLPTIVPSGGTVSATYNITNTTKINMTRNLVKWLPPNVEINPSLTTCTPSNAFNLNPGATCALGLTISGPINKNDTNPHHHLFVCMSDQATCAGPTPDNSLNVTQTETAYVAVGAYTPNTDEPGIATSPDGKTWVKQTLTPPDGFLFGSLQGVSCLGQLCVAAGLYTSSGSLDNAIPGIAISTNKGATWSQQAFTSLPSSPVVMTNGQLNGSNCTAQGCVNVGFFSTNSNTNYAAIFTSTDHSNWSYQALSLPTGVTNVELNGINCNTGICVAVGNFLDTTDDFQHPGIAISTNRAAWSQLELNLPVGYSGDASLNSVSCVQNSCIAVGSFTNSITSFLFPGVAVSSDNAKTTWTEQVLSTLPSTPPGISLVQGELIGISCTSTYCVAVGDYDDSLGNHYPGVAISIDSQHMVWSQTALTSLPSFSGIPMVQGQFNSVTCTNSVCIAVGVYADNNNISYPGVAYSSDNGNTWTQQVLPTLGGDVLIGVN